MPSRPSGSRRFGDIDDQAGRQAGSRPERDPLLTDAEIAALEREVDRELIGESTACESGILAVRSEPW